MVSITWWRKRVNFLLPATGQTNATHETDVKETPQNQKGTENLSHAIVTMEAHRVVEDLAQVPEISLEDYKKSILPHCVYLDYIHEIIEILQRNGKLKTFNPASRLRWSTFRNDPKDSEQVEDETFKYMETIAADIVKAAREAFPDGPEPTTIMECRPKQPPLSEGRNGGFKSDGHYRILQSRRPKCFKNVTSDEVVDVSPRFVSDRLACDRPALEEYQKHDRPENRNDDFAKLVGNASQHMYADPTRRFMFGTTIEDTTTRFWFFSRAVVLTSESFNFIEEHTHLIEYVLALSFATAEELGYDMSVGRVAYPLTTDSSEYTIQYDYRVGEKTYRTIDCLSSFRAKGLVSRATRVWRVFQLGHPCQQEYALKDVWLPSNAKTEPEIQQDIFDSIEKNNPGIGEKYREHFMKISQCEVVQTSQTRDDNMPDFVRQPLGSKKHVTLRRSEASKGSRILSGSDVAVPAGGTRPKAAPRLQHLYKGRKHVRIVFVDIGTPLSEVRNHNVLFTALGSTLEGLECLFKGHYVHRDISAGNILLCNGKAKISDLEYAKKFLSEGPRNDPKTGTPICMAIEAQQAHYVFYVSAQEDAEPDELTQDPPTPVFLHNYLHDVESLFWIGLHALFSTVPANYTEKQLAACELQHELFNLIFPHRLDGGPDRHHLFVSAEFDEPRKVLPAAYQPALEKFVFLRRILVYKYKYAYRQPNFPQHENFASVYSTQKPNLNLFLHFKQAVEAAYSGDTELLPDHDIEVTVPQRAPSFREENSDNDGHADDQTYIDHGSEYSDHEDDEEPPNKMRRKGGNAKKKRVGGPGVAGESVGSAHSAGKRKRT
ncbi:hypothetical protein F5146DRAFT_1223342 [Armillaria mellea]|nr:hypothetical protein F5146DRAFT_1223342 [Armillaria mellea]